MATTRPIILITGANSGIGLEAVKAFLGSASPYHIIFGSRSVEKGEKAIEEVKAEFPNSASTVELLQVDLTSDESIEAAFQAVSSKHGHIDALVNNAGTAVQNPSSQSMPRLTALVTQVRSSTNGLAIPAATPARSGRH